MESKGTILQCASNYMKEKNLSLLSQLLEKISTKLDSARKVNHADILVKLGQKWWFGLFTLFFHHSVACVN